MKLLKLLNNVLKQFNYKEMQLYITVIQTFAGNSLQVIQIFITKYSAEPQSKQNASYTDCMIQYLIKKRCTPTILNSSLQSEEIVVTYEYCLLGAWSCPVLCHEIRLLCIK